MGKRPDCNKIILMRFKTKTKNDTGHSLTNMHLMHNPLANNSFYLAYFVAELNKNKFWFSYYSNQHTKQFITYSL